MDCLQSVTSPGILRVLIFSADGNALPEGNGVLAEIPTDDEWELTKIEMSDPDGAETISKMMLLKQA